MGLGVETTTPSLRRSRRACFSVYHEGEASDGIIVDAYPDAYHVKKGRYGGWRSYAGEQHVVWDEFRYGYVNVDLFLGLVGGEQVAVPATYGKVPAEFSRIDVFADRPLATSYQMDRRRNEELGPRLYASFALVVHHFLNREVDEWSPEYQNAVVVRAADYDEIDWFVVEQSLIAGSELPPQVLCSGSPTTVEDFLYNLWRGTVDGKQRNLESYECHRWRIDVRHPAGWKKWFCEKHERFDVYGSNWVDPADVIWVTQELVCPFDAEFERGICVGIRASEGKPILSMVVDFSRRLSYYEAREYFGPSASVVPVVGDAQIYALIGQCGSSGYTMAFGGTIDYERFSQFA